MSAMGFCHLAVSNGVTMQHVQHKIYLMARYQRYPEMQIVAHKLRGMGYIVTSRWILGEHQASDAAIGTGTLGALEAQFARDDIEDLRQADLCVGFSEPM